MLCWAKKAIALSMSKILITGGKLGEPVLKLGIIWSFSVSAQFTINPSISIARCFQYDGYAETCPQAVPW